MVHQIHYDWLVRLSLTEMCWTTTAHAVGSRTFLGEQLALVLREAKSFRFQIVCSVRISRPNSTIFDAQIRDRISCMALKTLFGV